MDENMREEITKMMMEHCVLQTVLKPAKPCPYIGEESSACTGCTYGWITLVDKVMELTNVQTMTKMKDIFVNIATGFVAINRASDMVAEWEEEKDK